MNALRPVRVPVMLTALIVLVALPATVRAVDIIKFQGSATDIGVQRGPGQVGGVEFRINGIFRYDGPIDLSHSTVTFDLLLAELEPGGAGELLKTVDAAPFLPITLASDRASEVDEAQYGSPGSFRPQIGFILENNDGDIEFYLRVDRALARVRPTLCALDPKDRRVKTRMTHSFTINDGINPPIVVSFARLWECPQPDRYQMRSR